MSETRSVNIEEMSKEEDDESHSFEGKDSSSSASTCPSEDRFEVIIFFTKLKINAKCNNNKNVGFFKSCVIARGV